MWPRFFIFFFLFIATGAQAASMPPDAMALLQSFPGRALPLEYVLKRAVESSDQFRAIRASELALESSVWSALAPLDWRVGLSAGVENNRKQPTTPFGTQSQETVTFGLRKPTGQPIDNLAVPASLKPGRQRAQLDLLARLNREGLAGSPIESELNARVESL